MSKNSNFQETNHFITFFLTVLIEFKSALSIDQDFLFISIYSDAHTYLINADTQFIHVQNDFNQSIHIILKNSLEKIIEIKKTVLLC